MSEPTSLEKSKEVDESKERQKSIDQVNNNKEKKSSTDEDLSNTEPLESEELFEPSVWKNSDANANKHIDFANFSAKYEILKKEQMNRRLKFKVKKWKDNSAGSRTPPSKTPSKNSDDKIKRTGIIDILNVDSGKNIKKGKLSPGKIIKQRRNNSMISILKNTNLDNAITITEKFTEKLNYTRRFSNKNKPYNSLKKIISKNDESNTVNFINTTYLNTNNFIMKNIHKNKSKPKDISIMNNSVLRNIRNNIIYNKFKMEKELYSKLQINKTENHLENIINTNTNNSNNMNLLTNINNNNLISENNLQNTFLTSSMMKQSCIDDKYPIYFKTNRKNIPHKLFDRSIINNENYENYWPIYESKNLKEDEEEEELECEGENDCQKELLNYNTQINKIKNINTISQQVNSINQPINSIQEINTMNQINQINQCMDSIDPLTQINAINKQNEYPSNNMTNSINNLNDLNNMQNINQNEIKEFNQDIKKNEIGNNTTTDILSNFQFNSQIGNFPRSGSMLKLPQVKANFFNTSTMNSERSTKSNNNNQQKYEQEENFSNQSFPMNLSSNRSNNSQNTHLTSSSFGKINSNIYYGPNLGKTLVASASVNDMNNIDCLNNRNPIGRMKSFRNLNLNNISGGANSGTFFSGTHMMTSYLSTNSYTNTQSNESAPTAPSCNCLDNYKRKQSFGPRSYCYPGIRRLYHRRLYSETYNNVNENYDNTQKLNYSLNTPNMFKNQKPKNYTREQSGRTTLEVINVKDIALGKETRTTIMIRNIPIKYTEAHLEMEVNEFGNKYDCIYMPYDFEKQGNKGYAFINLVHPLHVLMFYEIFQGKSWKFFESKKICALNFAKFQGINGIKSIALSYDKIRKPNFYIIADDVNSQIEVPRKYLDLILKKYPKLDYIIKKQKNTVVINSFN